MPQNFFYFIHRQKLLKGCNTENPSNVIQFHDTKMDVPNLSGTRLTLLPRVIAKRNQLVQKYWTSLY